MEHDGPRACFEKALSTIPIGREGRPESASHRWWIRGRKAVATENIVASGAQMVDLDRSKKPAATRD